MSPDALPAFADASWLPWLDLWGRLHPLLVHVPLGVLPVLVLLEAWGLVRRKPLDNGVRRGLISASALVAVLAAVGGWLLAEEPAYGGADLELHRKLGIGLAAANLLAMLAAWTGVRSVYGWALAVAFGLLLPAGHLGGSMVHGDDFVTGPLFAALDGARYEPPTSAPTPTPSTAPSSSSGASGVDPSPAAAITGDARDSGSDYAETIAPLLAARCGNCHGERRQRGALALHTPDDILAGGEFGPALVVGDAAASELVRRMRLPLEHEDHMPPEGKTQPTPAEIAMLEVWIDGGAPFAGRVSWEAVMGVDAPPRPEPSRGLFDFTVLEAGSYALGAGSSTADPETELPAPATDEPVEPDADAVAALLERLVHVEVLDPANGRLWLDFAAFPSADDAALAELLPPLAGAVAELSLAGTQVTDAGLVHVARLDGLLSLDLRRTAVTAAGLTTLASLSNLQTLNVTSTELGDDAVHALASLSGLRRVHLFDSGLDAGALEQLAAARPELVVHAGHVAAADPLEVEPEVEFVSAAESAAPADEPAPVADLSPINTVCPVSGGPVDPRYVIVHEGRAIGFCCSMCPSTFWADPAAYVVE